MTRRIIPDFKEILNLLFNDFSANLNCHSIGTIAKFDATTQKATVSVNFITSVQNVGSDTSVLQEKVSLQDCPVICLGGGKGSLRFPIAVGDSCLVLFNDVDMDNYVTSGNVMVPNTNRRHDLSDAIVLVGLRPFTSPLATYSTSNTELIHGTSKLSLQDSITQLQQNTTQINLDTKVEIKNTLCSLKTALDNFVQGVQGMTISVPNVTAGTATVTGSFVDTTAKVALALTQIDGLLK